ncbi:MAG: hypothetical protein JWM41_2480 [Gemmatimonadetes bacterium]|nr:hypothetical protein [Gemmatimonadota bacterium]
MRDDLRTLRRSFRRGRALHFGVRRARLGAFLGSGGRCFSSGDGGFGDAQRFHARFLDARGFRGGGGLLRRELRGGFGGGGGNGRVLLGGGLDVGRLATAANRLADGGLGDGLWSRSRRRGGSRATATRGRRGSGLRFRTHTLLTLPACPDASDLVVREHAQMAANRNIHLSKNRDYFFGRHSELVGQLTD